MSESLKPARIAIIGSGSIGLYYGARLGIAGEDVRFLMRSDLGVGKRDGVRVVMAEGNVARPGTGGTIPALPGRATSQVLHPAAVLASTAEIGPVDFALITLKTTANGELPRLLPPLLHEGTTVVTLQNGLGNEELLAEIVGKARVMGGLCFIASTRTAPAVVTCYHPGSVTLGEFEGPAKDRTRDLAARFSKAGVECMATDNLMEARWKKLVWNVPFNGLAVARGGITTDLILERHLDEVRALMNEIAAVGRELAFTISDEFIQKQIDVTGPMGAYKPSSLVDHLAGREVEVEAIWGEPLRRAQRAGVTAPKLEALYRELKSGT